MVVRPPNKQEEKRKAQALEQLEADRVKLLLDYPFTGSILIRQNLIPVVDSRCETACTDGQNIFVNPDFYLAMTPGERRFLLAHEVWHTVFLHFQRRGKRDRDLFNIAADMEVNALLRSEKFKIPADALLPKPSWKGFNAEEIYEKLLPQDAVKTPTMDIHLEPGANIDDMTGEELAFACDRLREAGAKDVSLVPMAMKQGRPGHLLVVLAAEGDADNIASAILRETSTFGVRRTDCTRYALCRRIDDGTDGIRIKTGEGYGTAKSKREFADRAAVVQRTGKPICSVARG